ncbi:MAG: YndJ family transporter [Planctomycetota bacterium]
MATPAPWFRLASWGALTVAARGALAGAPPDDLAAIERVLGFVCAVAVPLVLACEAAGVLVPLLALGALGVVLTPDVGAPWPWVGCLPWALACAVLFGAAARDLVRRRCLPSAARAVARLFLLVGAGWLIAGRAQVELPGLVPEKVYLACAHASITGFAAFSLLARLAELAPRARVVLAGLGALLGLGFAATGLAIAFAPDLEWLGATLLLLALGGYAAVAAFWILPGLESRSAALLLGLSTLALAVGLGLGFAHSLRTVGLEAALTRGQLVVAHGWLLAAGFAGLGGLGLVLAGARPPAGTAVLLFDGECGMCTRSVQTILSLERSPELLFAPLQGETAKQILRRHPVAPLEGPFDSLLLVHDLDGPREHVDLRWRAVCAIGRRMGSPWRWLSRLGALWVPRSLADLGYDIVAKNRLRFGGPDQCKIPSVAQRARFLA